MDAGNNRSKGKDLELPPHKINDDGSIEWQGSPLKTKHLKPVLYSLRKAAEMAAGERIEDANLRWYTALELAGAILKRLPDPELLEKAIPELPPAPPLPKKPRKTQFYEKKDDPSSLCIVSFEVAMKKWERKQEAFNAYQEQLPGWHAGLETWRKFRGELGIDVFKLHWKHFSEVNDALLDNLMNPERVIYNLPFEVLPAGMWSMERLLGHLGGRGWKTQEIVEERLEHLQALKPIRIYQGSIHREYRDYLVFIYAEDGSAVLESPFHGNATYLLKKEWFRLCQMTKAQLMRDLRAVRIIHHDMPSWRHEMCLKLGKKMPRQSNEY